MCCCIKIAQSMNGTKRIQKKMHVYMDNWFQQRHKSKSMELRWDTLLNKRFRNNWKTICKKTLWFIPCAKLEKKKNLEWILDTYKMKNCKTSRSKICNFKQRCLRHDTKNTSHKRKNGYFGSNHSQELGKRKLHHN